MKCNCRVYCFFLNKIFVEKTPKLPMFHSKLQTKNNSRSLHHVVGVGRKDIVDLVALGIIIMPMLASHWRIDDFFCMLNRNRINPLSCFPFNNSLYLDQVGKSPMSFDNSLQVLSGSQASLDEAIFKMFSLSDSILRMENVVQRIK